MFQKALMLLIQCGLRRKSPMVTTGSGWQLEDLNELKVNPLCITIYFCQWCTISLCAVCWALMLMGNLAAHLVDVNCAILLGQFRLEERIYMKVPRGFQKFYPAGGLLFLK